MKRYIRAAVKDLGDESFDGRLWVSQSSDTRVGDLVRLANDSDDIVRQCVARNPNTPEDVRKQIVNSCQGWETMFKFFLNGTRMSPEDANIFSNCFAQAVAAQGYESHGIDYDPDDDDTYDIVYAFSQWIPLESVSQAIIDRCLADLGKMGYHQYAEAEDLYG